LCCIKWSIENKFFIKFLYSDKSDTEVQNLPKNQKFPSPRKFSPKNFPKAAFSSPLTDQLYLAQNISKKKTWQHFILFVTVRTT